MMRTILLVLCLCVASARVSAQTWQTTFDCPKEWQQTNQATFNEAGVCAANDLITVWGAWTTASGNGDSIVAAANNPLGKGMGFRHMRGGASASNINGQNNNAGGIRIDIPSRPRNVWIRWYMRWQQGFAWQYINYTKDLYFNVNGGSSTVFTVAFNGWDDFGVGMVNPGSTRLIGNPGWRAVSNNLLGDGRFHAYEVHIDTASNLVEAWIDGKQVKRSTGQTNLAAGVNLGGGTIDFFLVGSNQCCVAVQPDMYTDYDDFVISTTGYIGPISSIAPPDPLTNVRVS